MLQVAIVGGTGYTGVELIRLLSSHPEVTIKWLTSRSEAGKPVASIFPSLRGISDLVYSDLGEQTVEALAECDVVFFATPHGVAMQQAQKLVDAGVKVIDLAADFRLQSLEAFEHWYKHQHACPELLKQAAYGLPEINRDAIKSAQVIGNPGCYPTTAILGLKPIIDAQNADNKQLVESRIIIDAKSGVSGAGRQAKLNLNYAETTDNFNAYGVTGHRHLPEIEQGVHQLLGSKFTHNIRFVPHLVPMIRGMFTTIHLGLTEEASKLDLQSLYENAYKDEQFIDVLPQGEYPDTRSVRASNRLRIAVHQNNDRQEATILVVQDNLVKGAAGQAVQCMNVMFGFDEALGLNHVPVVP
ncbi:N-acetyl-gamma-glutamyl-phosphate reductase [Psychrobacter sp. FDAARGOS_221]|uniref:N-acetyl-gamma-glutamyl-phosphate reductase n=1 Tax=Psychrobacter sp. FDAARGOS_221 TaxID=1975705 RepID=UPI000BB53BD4|nr:N-acetyl-gamma-glutamyl-phosphate reductase [Psychrobacter sp. FDAARGOS_221]PNK59958.1 N-acetyl-gamma-glutamyl-phosphate reductase [Psychrobacter sp. FDAARGOS_221]